MRHTAHVAAIVCLVGAWVPAAAATPARPAALPDPQFGQVLKRAEQFKELQISDQDEARVGAAVSEKIRARYGVAQDQAVHKYVTLAGSALAQVSSRPDIAWHFIVLDTDGVNAFAAPGGWVHITRGALGLIKNEAELAGVLAHEVEHVTEKHTMKAIQKNKAMQMGANETLQGNSAYFSKVVDKALEAILDGFGRGEEIESDTYGIALANKLGYQPAGLRTFLTRLTERNKGATQKQGLFASHPEMQERLDKITKQIASDKLTGSLTLDDRYKQFIKYEAKPQTEIAAVVGGAGLAGGSEPAKSDEKDAKSDQEAKPRRGFGLGSLTKPSDGGEKKSAQVTASGGGRGVNTEREAKGGSNPSPVVVTVTPAEVSQFKKDGNLK